MRHTAPGNKRETMYYIQSSNKCTKYIHILRLNIKTYKNPFPQPRGPKNSSVGRQTFLHTPLRLGQDHGKDAASFSTTVMTGKYFSQVWFSNHFNSWKWNNLRSKACRDIISRLTIKQKDSQERQNNSTITSHTCVWFCCSKLRIWPVSQVVFWSDGRSEDNLKQQTVH